MTNDEALTFPFCRFFPLQQRECKENLEGNPNPFSVFDTHRQMHHKHPVHTTAGGQCRVWLAKPSAGLILSNRKARPNATEINPQRLRKYQAVEDNPPLSLLYFLTADLLSTKEDSPSTVMVPRV